ncbi:E3 ubiquitin-protein ligase hrd1 [Xylographa pallens]|nr:E3 ubiquitin-protein ligase hrd1 [Xylographa pallens]
MRFTAYAGTSMVLATGVIIRALHQRTNFYSACVYLAQSNACLMILTNLVLLGVCGIMFSLQKLLYGPLRPIEVEQLYEKAWFAITETCLAMTIFREEVGGWFVVMFVSLLIGKIWGWIGEGRVEILEQQPPANPRLFHARLSTSLVLSICFEMYMLNYSIQTVRQQARPNMMVIFAFEFAVLTVTSMSTFARYTISLYEASVIKKQTNVRLQERRAQLQHEQEEAAAAVPAGQPLPVNAASIDDDLEFDIDVPGWEEKGRWVFYLDLATDFFKLVLYLTFFCVLCMFYGMPIHIIRDVAMTIRSFYKRITDFVRYRQATRDMNERYPDATAEEIGGEDVCIICREAMRPWQALHGTAANDVTPPTDSFRSTDERLRPKKLPCGHILHFACLRSWLERQQNCPTCRRPVLATSSVGGGPGPQAVNQQGQIDGPVNVVNNGAQGLEGNQQAGVRPNRIRVFNLGPIRLGFGAGQDIQGLAEHLNNQAPAQQPQNRNHAGDIAQQLGFGLRFGRQPQVAIAQQGTSQSRTNGVQDQLQTIERQLMQDINDLRAQADQLYLVRALQGELARLRITQAHANPGQTGGAQISGSARLIPANLTSTGLSNTPSQHAVQAFSANEHETRLVAGSRELPQGLIIPEGWTLLPLQRVSTGIGIAPQHGVPAQESTNWLTSSSNFTVPSRATPMDSEPSTMSTDSAATHADPNVVRASVPDRRSAEATTTSMLQPEESRSSTKASSERLSSQNGLSGSKAGVLQQVSNNEDDGSTKQVERPSGLQLDSRRNRDGEEPTAGSSWESVEAPATSSAEGRADKGKGRATTVEDAWEGID